MKKEVQQVFGLVDTNFSKYLSIKNQVQQVFDCRKPITASTHEHKQRITSTHEQKNSYLNMICVMLMIKNNHKVIFIPKCTTQWFEVHYLFIYILFHVLVWFVMWVPIKSVRLKCSFIAMAQAFQCTFLKAVPVLWPPVTTAHRFVSMYDDMVGVHEIRLAAISCNCNKLFRHDE